MSSNDMYGGGYYAMMIGGIIISLLFALLILIPASKQLKPDKANRRNQLFVMVLACLTGSIFGIVFIAIGMGDENRYLILSERRKYDNSLLD